MSYITYAEFAAHGPVNTYSSHDPATPFASLAELKTQAPEQFNPGAEAIVQETSTRRVRYVVNPNASSQGEWQATTTVSENGPPWFAKGPPYIVGDPPVPPVFPPTAAQIEASRMSGLGLHNASSQSGYRWAPTSDGWALVAQ